LGNLVFLAAGLVPAMSRMLVVPLLGTAARAASGRFSAGRLLMMLSWNRVGRLSMAVLDHQSRTTKRGARVPYVNIQITKGATREQRAELVKDVTNSLVRVLGKKPEHTHVVIQEIADEHWGFAGLLTDEWRRTQSEDR
jgi:4-oxalocrotonate tautomerase